MLLGLVAYFIPYKNIASQKITEALHAQDIKVSKLDIKSIDNEKVVISEIALGDDSSLKIKDVTVKYNLQNAVKGKVDFVEVGNIDLQITRNENGLSVAGIDSFLNKPSSGNGQLDIDQVFKNLPDKISVKNIQISFVDKDLSIATSIGIEANINHQNKTIQSSFKSTEIEISGLPIELQAPVVVGKLDLNEGKIVAAASIANQNLSLNLDLDLSVDVKRPNEGKLQITKLKIPFGGGSVMANKISTSTDFKNPIEMNLTIKNVELSELVGKVSNGDIKGKGKLSGNLKLIYHMNGKIEVQNGKLSGNEEGIINVASTMIPGDNEQVAMTRKVLENFHYNILEMSILADKDDNSLINMVVEGKNPEYMEGKKVKLNINLSGDTIPMLKRSLLPMSDVKTLIDSGDQNAK